MKTIKEIAFYFKDYINLEQEGFKMYEFNLTHLHYYKQNVNSKLEFIIGVNYTNPLHEEIAYAGFNAGVEISEVEDILLPLYAKNFTQNHINRSLPARTISFNQFTGVHEMWEILRPYFDIDLRNNKFKVEELAEEIKEQISLHVEPFWKKYSDIQYINDEIINKKGDSVLYNYIIGLTPFKKLIIMKLCKNPEYESFKNNYFERLTRALDKDKFKNEPYYNLLIDLINYLESGKFLEVI